MSNSIFRPFMVIALLGITNTTILAAPKNQNNAITQGASEARLGPMRFKLPEPELRKSKMDALAQKKRQEAVERLKGIIPRYTGPQKAEFIFRLAELYWESQKYFYLKAMQDWDIKLQKWYEAGSKGKQPQLDDRESEVYKQQALHLYQTILDKYPAYQRKDEVLYVMAFNLYESGKTKEAMDMYLTLIMQYPNSRYVADAYLQMGDHFFNGSKLSAAVKAYKKALHTNKPKIYSYALYKLAWCDFNLQEYPKAQKKLQMVVDYADNQKGRSNVEGGIGEKDRIQLREEALNDMTMVFSRVDDYDGALAYFRAKVDDNQTYNFMSKIASLFSQQGKWDLQIKTLKLINTEYPYHEKAPANQSNIVKAFASLNKDNQVRNEVRKLIDLYRPQSEWAEKNSNNKQAISQAYELTETALRELVTEYHRDAQKYKNVGTYKLARDIYKEYLDYFNDSPFAYRMRFFYAEILYALKEFDLASREYDQTVDSDSKGKFVKPAAYNAILCYEKLVEGIKEKAEGKIDDKAAKGTMKKLERLEKLKKGQKYEPTELSEWEQKLANAYDRFVSVAPKDDEVVKVKFKSARLYYIHNRFTDAAERFGEIIDRWPHDSLARAGAQLILESFNTRKNWSELRKWSAKFTKNNNLMKDKTFAAATSTFLEGSTFKEIQTIIEPKAPAEETANHYLSFVKNFPTSKFAMVALYNSIVYFDKDNQLDVAIEQSKRLLHDFKDFKLSSKDKQENKGLPQPDEITERVLYGLAVLYERIADFHKSAVNYEKYGNTYPKAKNVSDAWYNAALYQQGLGNIQIAINDYQNYLAAAPTAEDAPVIYWRIGTLYEKIEDYKNALNHFDRFERNYQALVGGPRILLSRSKVATAFQKLHKTKEALATFKDIQKRFTRLPADAQKDPESTYALAQATFELLKENFDDYMKLKLRLPQRVLEKTLNQKIEQLAVLEKEYTNLLAIGEGSYGIAALFHIGRLYQNLANTLLNAPVPSRLTEDQKMFYQAALQEKAFPLEEKAIEAYEKALAKSFELGIYNDWAVKTQKALSEYDPGRFPQQRTFALIPSKSEAIEIETIEPNDLPDAELQGVQRSQTQAKQVM